MMKPLEPLLLELQGDPNTLSIVLIGSVTTGKMDTFSDLDVLVVVRAERPAVRIFYSDDRLVSVYFVDRQNRESALTDPWKAIWNVAPMRKAQILFDPDGWYKNLQKQAHAFTWAQVAAQADRGISYVMAEHVEIVHKILSGLRSGDDEKMLKATTSLLVGITDVAALAAGVLVQSENRFWSSVRDAQTDPIWKNLYWKALGFHALSVSERAEAAVELYSRTALLNAERLLPEHSAVVNSVCAWIEQRST